MRDRKKVGRILTKEEQIWCNRNKLTIGFDLDTRDFQHSHIVKTTSKTINSLCKTRWLWFEAGKFSGADSIKTNEGEDNRITCIKCLICLKQMISKKS